MKESNDNGEMRTVSFIEDDYKQGEVPNKLSLWMNDRHKLYVEIGTDDPTDLYGLQWLTLGLDDAKELREELTRIIGYMEYVEREESQQVKRITPPAPIQTPAPRQAANGELFTHAASDGKPFKWVP